MVEKVRVLVVDDSSFFRKRIRDELELTGEISVVGEAVNGREAVEMSARLKPDLITMDVAMPVMDGISAVREIMRTAPTNIIMFSALTRDGARATLDALEAGAVDFLAKPAGAATGAAGSQGSLSQRVVSIARRHHPHRVTTPARPIPAASAAVVSAAKPRRLANEPRLVLIGASTGGPVAIQRVLSALPRNFPLPVLVAVHMPAEFTSTFAERLDSVCQVRVSQAADGEVLLPGQVLVAPGGRQVLVEQRGSRLQVGVRPGGEQLYKPSVDLMFGSAARSVGGSVLAVILTGMGADGTEGARLLKERGATVWSQDQASSVVYGMPLSVVKAGYSDRVLPLPDIGPALAALA
ncbi:MAG: chemotaxis response regulator protein-glutamate methylesterase [Gammaproteobacteria bacterium]|nr:chemotaxis response regulator protein-glutamate methylesterase [Gammaproteobacteria bacterium]